MITVLRHMKKFILLVGVLAGVFVRGQSAEASVAYCLARGYVQLDFVTSDWIDGVIGEETVGLAYYQNYIYGEFKGETVELTIRRDNTVVGKVGRFPVRWYTDGKGHIFGFQRCMLVISDVVRPS